MRITAGAGNPKWTFDETILALDLLLRRLPTVPGANDPEVIQLSQFLRELPIHPIDTRKDSFRNPDGIGLKLQNINSVRIGHGLSNSALDREIWAKWEASLTW